MAGAVSAGAYNAGVFDFLIQALEEWERARREDQARPSDQRSVPDHRILIPVISGASAGGATAALGAFSLSEPTRLPSVQDAANTKYVLPALYRIWVESISFFKPDESQRSDSGENANSRDLGTLLDTSDLGEGQRPVSIMNGTVLERAANDAVARTITGAKPRPYLTEGLHLFLTITNLRGVPYGIRFTAGGGSDAHVMSMHADRVHYCMTGLGAGDFESNWLKAYGDLGTPISTDDIVAAASKANHSERNDHARRFIKSALATGAFPIGLPAQKIEVHTSDYTKRAWPYANPKQLGSIEPLWPPNDAGEHSYQVDYAGSDGGLINNEPFEIARWTIMETPGQRNKPGSVESDRAVLLVDPFPEPTGFDPNLSDKPFTQTFLREVIAALFPTLKNQARVKAIDLARSGNNKEVFSRFLIAPSRKFFVGDEEFEAAEPLATGVFNAFGGFLTSKFPEHDYQLGRRNCQKFLREHFRVSAENEVVKSWPEGCEDRHTISGEDGKRYRVLIPLFGSANVPIPAPVWPHVTCEDVDNFMEAVRKRGNALVRTIAKTELGGLYGLGLKIFWRIRRKHTLGQIRTTLVADLIRRNQLALETELTSDLERSVLACLVELKTVQCSPEHIAETVNRRANINPKAPRTTAVEVRDVLDNNLAAYLSPQGSPAGFYLLKKKICP
ncbi:patatin-like phospholipase family protein [Hoeflea poritis]|uniref:PNPLA domain-containing protein n=1 Tax=Hoeflea poritis TaxID=2993659 RepID=A0ABT4VNF5_9HYPH|nr:patatin-like phospholipase family protein [Hoeflea poritis]MDA4846244.1 hypothetical protein [Hoeflea poritis]